MNKIEEIIMHNYNPSLLVGRGSRHLPKDTLMRAEKEKKEDLIAIQGMVRELQTLRQEWEREAVEGFAKHYIGQDHVTGAGIGILMLEVEQYLTSTT